MTSKRFSFLFLLSCFVLLISPGWGRAEIIAVSGEGDIYSIDERTGAGTRIGTTGIIHGPISMAMDTSGTLYSCGRNIFNDRVYLITIDPGGGFEVGPRVSIFPPSALAFSPDDTLFALEYNSLYTIHVDSGATAVVATNPLLRRIQGLDFGPDGRLYGWQTGETHGEGGMGLVTIDTGSGVVTDVDPTVGSPIGIPGPVATLAFAPDGTLYGAQKDLFTVDVSSGALTLIGPIDAAYFGISGMAYIPEPSTFALATIAMLGLITYARRKRRHG